MSVVAARAPARPRITAPKVPSQKILIGGRWVDAASGKTFPTLNPATGETICQVAEGGQGRRRTWP